MPRGSNAVSKEVRQVIEDAYEGARADLGGRLDQEQVDQKALRDGVAAVRGAIAAMIELDQPEHPVLGVKDPEDFFAKVHRAPTLRDAFLNKAVLALIERFGASARNVDVLREALAPLEGRAAARTARSRDERMRDDKGANGTPDSLTEGRYGYRRGEIRDAVIRELKKWVDGGEKERFTNAAAMHEKIGCDDRTARRVFDWFVEQRLLEQHGKGAGTHYMLTTKGRRELLGKADGTARQAVA